MQTPPGPQPPRAEDPATIAEVAIGDHLPDDVDDSMAFVGAVLFLSGWSPEVELRELPDQPEADAAQDNAPSPDDDVPTCGGDNDHDADDLPTFAPVVTVRGVQERLAWLGWHKHAPTGELDARTRASLLAFQEAAGVPRTGTPDGNTRDALAARIGW